MKYIALPTNEIRQLSFYLAMEEYVARHVSEPDCFFMWQVEPSVIFGRNQVLENEVAWSIARRITSRYIAERAEAAVCMPIWTT
jgi:lipoic acid synthetase/lipoate-protein ligase A